jgi:hypothetical protein
VYTDINFQGEVASIRDDTPDLVPYGLNDRISSIRIPNGETWEVCQDVNYANQCQVLEGSVADLRGMGWNDRISSLRRIDNGGFRDRRSYSGIAPWESGTGITVYVDINFGGQRASFRGDIPSLVLYGLNDQISSIRIPNGETWEMCQDIDYASQCQELSGSVADLRNMGWNDRISSLRRIDSVGFRDDRFRDRRSGDVFQNGAQQGLLFYDRPGYTGRSTLVMGGSSNIGSPAWQGSVRLRGASAWELCDNSGGCVTINQDVSDVSQLGLTGRIISARAVNDYQYRRNGENDRNR